MDKVKIFVVCHKPWKVRCDDVYTPIHVGRSLSHLKNEMAWMQGDDTGENISAKNMMYCEMTAQYWVWRNVSDVEYVGFVHYRRDLDINISNENIHKFIKSEKEVIMAGPLYRSRSRYAFFTNFVSFEDRAILHKIIETYYPEYLSTYIKYSNGYIDYPCNMLICNKNAFNQYCEWIFGILDKCEKYIRLADYSRAKRIFGYIAEFLMPVYFLHQNFKIKSYPLLTPAGKRKVGIKERIKIRLLEAFTNENKPIWFDPSIQAGLVNDGICIGKDEF